MNIKKRKEKAIDCSLMESADGRCIRPRAGAFFLRFAKQRKDGVLFTVSKQGHALTVSYRKRLFMPFPQPAVTADGYARYKTVERGVDLAYMPTEDAVEAMIVVTRRRVKYRFVFTLQTTKGLSVFLAREGQDLLITDMQNKNQVFRLSAFRMVDAAQVSLDAVACSLKPARDGWRLLVEADSLWISDKNRVLPVCISSVLSVL